jgi:hypothetical protein
MPTLPPSSATPSAAPIAARPAGPAPPGAQVVLRAGAEVVARVVEAPANGGRGVIALAGALLAARLPAGLAVGQTLALTVAGAERGEILLRLRAAAGGGGAEQASRAKVAGALAASGDGDLVRIAAALQPPGGGVELPGGELVAIHLHAPGAGAASFVVEGDAEGEEAAAEGGEASGEAGFVLHSAALGPLEVRLRLAGGALTATVVVEPATLVAARGALPDLAAGLARAVGAEVAVGLQERGAGVARPAPPRVEEAFDAYA